ncbi:MAG TPA: NUDIX hydrolase, partial [Anaerolineales bacterium]
MNTNYSGYEQPAVTVDLVLFTVNSDALKVMLIRRADDPFAGDWSIPGGFLKAGESLEEAALRVLREKTVVENVYLEQLYTFGDPDRDPRGRVVTVTYIALIPWQHLSLPESQRVTD